MSDGALPVLGELECAPRGARKPCGAMDLPSADAVERFVPWRWRVQRPPGNTAYGAVRKCGSGRSLGRDRQVFTVRGCVGLFADSDLKLQPCRDVIADTRGDGVLRPATSVRWETTARLRWGRRNDSEHVRPLPAYSAHEGCSPNTRATHGCAACQGWPRNDVSSFVSRPFGVPTCSPSRLRNWDRALHNNNVMCKILHLLFDQYTCF